MQVQKRGGKGGIVKNEMFLAEFVGKKNAAKLAFTDRKRLQRGL